MLIPRLTNFIRRNWIELTITIFIACLFALILILSHTAPPPISSPIPLPFLGFVTGRANH